MSNTAQWLGQDGPGIPCTLIYQDEVNLEEKIAASEKMESPTTEQSTAFAEWRNQLDQLRISNQPRTLQFMPMGNLEIAEFEVLLEDRASSAAIRTRRSLRKEAQVLRDKAATLTNEESQSLLREAAGLEREAANYMQEHDKQVSGGAYALGGEAAADFLRTLDGISRMAWLMLRAKQPTMSFDDVRLLMRDGHDEEMSVAMHKANQMGKQKPQPAKA